MSRKKVIETRNGEGQDRQSHTIKSGTHVFLLETDLVRDSCREEFLDLITNGFLCTNTDMVMCLLCVADVLSTEPIAMTVSDKCFNGKTV